MHGRVRAYRSSTLEGETTALRGIPITIPERTLLDLSRVTTDRPFVEAGMPEEELPRIRATAARVKPLALEALVAEFTLAMEAQIERAIARELERANP